jgi:hypothetical protein
VFEETSLEISKRFLQTAVVVDDGSFSKRLSDVEVPTEIVDPTELSPEEIETLKTSISDGTSSPPNFGLDSDAVLDGFWNEGLICSVLKPTDEVPIASEPYTTLLKKADLIVLDWNLVKDGQQDNGQQVKEVIRSLVSPEEGGSRFRVVVIYTGGTNLAQADEELSNLLAERNFRADGYLHRRGHTVIAVFAKAGGIADTPDASRQFGEAELAKKCIEIFSEATRGLLSNAVLKGLALVRQESHKLLERFGDNCDPAFLVHRMLTRPPADVEDQIVPLIVAELEAILAEGGAGTSVGFEAVSEYLEHRRKTNRLNLSVWDDRDDKVLEAVSVAMRDGLESDHAIRAFKSLRDNPYLAVPQEEEQGNVKEQEGAEVDLAKTHRLCQSLSGSEDINTGSFDELSMLMSLQQGYGDLPPMLGPGTIVKEGARFWLCVQPACDSVRISNARVFPFLKLTKQTGDRFDYIVRMSDGTCVRLRVEKRLYEGILVKFKPDMGVVRAKRVADTFEFVSAPETVEVNSNGRKYTETKTRSFIFVSQVKVLHALREADRLASELGRVGLTEFEWIRRCSSR